MRVIDQARLWFREGTSDKVYEVDLVEVAANQYMVNFRFGRRGTNLKDGTKTPTTVSLDKARTIFTKLVAEKTAGGYRSTADGAPAGAAPRKSGNGSRSDGDPAMTMAEDVLTRLALGHESSIGPAIWRAGDMDLTQAEPSLQKLLDKPPPRFAFKNRPAIWQHVIVAALARCGTTASLGRLEGLLADPKTEPHVRDVTRIAIARIAPDRAATLARPLLPPELATALDRGSPSALAAAAEELMAKDPGRMRAGALALYLLDGETTRAAVLAIVRVAKVDTQEAVILRTLFRAAELRRDGALYVAIARRIDAHTGGRNVWDGRRYKPPTMGPRTRGYFRRRTARVLRRLGRVRSPDYVAMATAWLLGYSDDDAQDVRRGGWTSCTYDRFARYHTLNDILYGHSPRYTRAHHGRSVWKCVDFRPGDPVPHQREERFPALWDAAPAALWHLIGAARTTPVIECATKALRANRPFVDALPDEALAGVLATGHPLAQKFAFDMVSGRPMSTALARGALASDLTDAYAWVLRWIATHLDEAARDPEMIALLVTGKTSLIRDTAMTLLRGRTLAAEVARSVALRVIAIMIGMDDTSNERASGAANIVLLAIDHTSGSALRDIAPEILRDMIERSNASALSALGEFAGELMLRHANRDSLPAALLEALLASPHPAVRAIGGRILATMPPEIAKDDPEALILFAVSANAELRENTRSLVGEVARRFPDVGRRIADRLVDLLINRLPEGVPAHVVSLLRRELAHCLPQKPSAMIMKLVGALSPHAREAGGLLLHQVNVDDIGLDDIARLAHNEIIAIRQGAWALARGSVRRYKLAPVAVSRLVDSPWEDTRTFAIDFISTELSPLSADAIIAICDSIRPEVQAFGKQLIQTQFQSADAGRYLVRLAEHPSTNLQLLVSGFLEHHVADPERIRAIAPYLVTVLSQVNRGRVAKERVMNLVRREASRSVEAAHVLAPILDRQSATIAKTQKHPLIATMVDVRTVFPDVPLPIAITAPVSVAKRTENG